MDRYFHEPADDLAIASENIALLDSRQADLFESRSALWREVVLAVTSDTDGETFRPDHLREVYDAIRRRDIDEGELVGYFSPHTVKCFFDSISVAERVDICRALGKRVKLPSDTLRFLIEVSESQQNDALDGKAEGRIAYMKNNYTESAFMKFSKVLGNARSAYFQSFDAVCEEVYSGGCEFCILPLESSAEGRLNSFYTMIDRFELKIAAVCDIEHHDSQRFTRFALLKKSLSETTTIRHSKKDQILEFRFSSTIGGHSPLGDILQAATACGLRLLRLASLPLPYNDEMLSYYVSFTLDNAEVITFLTFIALEFPQCDPLGVYFTVK